MIGFAMKDLPWRVDGEKESDGGISIRGDWEV